MEHLVSRSAATSCCQLSCLFSRRQSVMDSSLTLTREDIVSLVKFIFLDPDKSTEYVDPPFYTNQQQFEQHQVRLFLNGPICFIFISFILH